MTEFLMCFINYTFVVCVRTGVAVVFAFIVWAVQEFSKGFLSVFIGAQKAEEIATWIPYCIAGLLIAILCEMSLRS